MTFCGLRWNIRFDSFNTTEMQNRSDTATQFVGCSAHTVFRMDEIVWHEK